MLKKVIFTSWDDEMVLQRFSRQDFVSFHLQIVGLSAGTFWWLSIFFVVAACPMDNTHRNNLHNHPDH